MPPTERDRQLQAPSTAAIQRVYVDPKKDIAAERAKATFPVHDLSALIYGSADAVEGRRKVIDYVSQQPEFNKDDKYFRSRAGIVEMGVRMSMKLLDTALEWGIDKQFELKTVRDAIATPTGVDLHYAMFIPTLQGQMSADQVAEWLPKVASFQILGTYAQTELGHGTFLRGLETTATYDKATREFVVHSPTITATKWWPGGLGKTANYVVLMARLFIDGKDYGPHTFFIQIRRLEDHTPLPGIQVGDIGPKMGFAGVDNGYLRFDHVRVPRDAMLSKLAHIDDHGQYIVRPSTSKKANYGTMVFVRANIVYGSTYALAKAVTIAVRYSAVRRQTARVEGQLESQVIDYQTQQNYLFPLIAQTFALHFTGEYMLKLYKDYQSNQDSPGSSTMLPELHAASAGLKSLVTNITANAIEVCRKCCGGHGFSLFSGLPTLYEDTVAACTYEGENTVMALQTARYLLKAMHESMTGHKLEGQSKYLEGALTRTANEVCAVVHGKDFLNPNVQLAAYQHRAAQMILRATQEYDRHVQAGKDAEDAWSLLLVDFEKCSHAHCWQLIIDNFITAVNTLPANSAVKPVLETMRNLFALHNILEYLGDFTEDGYLSVKHVALLRQQHRSLLAAVRPNAVALVDAWALSDFELASCLGRHDGDVYEALFAMAQKSELNKTHTGPGYDEYLKPRFHSNL